MRLDSVLPDLEETVRDSSGAGGGEAGEQPSEAFSSRYLTAHLSLFLLQTFSWAREFSTPPPTMPPSPFVTQQQSPVKINETARLYFRVGCSSWELPCSCPTPLAGCHPMGLGMPVADIMLILLSVK